MLICLCGLTSLTQIASADGYKPRIIPECKVYKVKPGLEVCGYATIEDVKALYKADAELYTARQIQFSLDLRLAYQAEQASDLRDAVESTRSALAVVDARNLALTAELLDTDLKYQKALVRPKWGSQLAWGTAAIASALLAGFVGHAMLVE